MKLSIRTAGVAAAALTLVALILPGSAGAKPWWMRGVESNEGDFLDPDVAFRAASRVDGNVLRVRWVIADRYYLYRQRMDIQAESPDLKLGEPSFPQGTLKTDPYLGTQEIFTQQVEATVPFTRLDAGAHPIQVKVTYQGCAEAGLCYHPAPRCLSQITAAPPPRPKQKRNPGRALPLPGAGLPCL